MKNKWKIYLGLIGILTLFACDNGASDDLQEITFVLDWTPNTNHTGLYVAQEQGYFEEEGLEVEIVQPSDGDASTIVASNRAQFGISAQDSLAPTFASDDPLQITTVATVLQHNTSGIMSRQGEGMDQPSGLEGNTYATWDAPVEQAMIADVMEKDGGDFSQVELIPNNIVDEPQALREEQADAIWVFYGWGGITAEIEDVAIDYFYFSDLNPVFDYYTPVIVANNSFLEENEEAAKSFLKAVEKGYQFAIDSPEDAAEILVNQVPELNEELVLASQQWISNEYQSDAEKWGYIDPTRWNDFYTWLGDNQLIEQEIPENTGFSNDYLPE